MKNLQLAENMLTTVDLAENPALTYLDLSENQLSELDLRNGNNGILTSLNAQLNPDLNCISVSDLSHAQFNWTNIDPQTSFNLNCANPVGCPEDVNGDGIVDIDDFVAFNSSFNDVCSGCAADINGDGVVDVDDFVQFNSAFGELCD